MPNINVVRRSIFSNNIIPFSQKSLLLDGVAEYVNMDSVVSDLFSTTQGTWSMWVKPIDANPAGVGAFISFGESGGDSLLLLSITTSGLLQAFAIDSTSTVQWYKSTLVASFSDNTFTHIGITHNGTTVMLYVDGIAVGQTFFVSTDTTFWFNDLGLIDNGRIGQSLNNSIEDNFLNGNIEDLNLWDTALSASELADISKSPSRDLSKNFGNYVSSGSLITRYRMGDDPAPDNYNVTVANEWYFFDSIGGNDAQTVNCEESDVQLDVVQ